MKPRAQEIVLNRWPYGLEVRTSRHGLVLQPRRKARANWEKQFKTSLNRSDDLAVLRKSANEFDAKEWQ
jgi:hypothetical protein